MNITPNDILRFWSKVEFKHNQCWCWQASTIKNKRTGLEYGQFTLGKKHFLAHRFSFILKNGSIPEGLHIRHSCHNTLCVNPKHLLSGTKTDNEQDKKRAGRTTVGERHGNAKLTWSLVNEIRNLWITRKYTLQKLSVIYKLGELSIRDIVKNITWVVDDYIDPNIDCRTRLTLEDNYDIVRLYKEGWTQTAIGKKYNICQQRIGKIIRKYHV